MSHNVAIISNVVEHENLDVTEMGPLESMSFVAEQVRDRDEVELIWIEISASFAKGYAPVTDGNVRGAIRVAVADLHTLTGADAIELTRWVATGS